MQRHKQREKDWQTDCAEYNVTKSGMQLPQLDKSTWQSFKKPKTNERKKEREGERERERQVEREREVFDCINALMKVYICTMYVWIKDVGIYLKFLGCKNCAKHWPHNLSHLLLGQSSTWRKRKKPFFKWLSFSKFWWKKNPASFF